MARYDFEIIGEMEGVETIARGTGVRIRHFLNQTYGAAIGVSEKALLWSVMKTGKWVVLKSIGLKRMESDACYRR